jgi:hypothetical protein
VTRRAVPAQSSASSPGTRRVPLPGLLAAGARLLTAACGGGASPPVPAPPAGPGARPAATPPGDAETLTLAACTGMWHACAAAARTVGYQPGALSQYAAGDALMILTRSLHDDHRPGLCCAAPRPSTRGSPA